MSIASELPPQAPDCICLICRHGEPAASNVWLDTLKNKNFDGAEFSGICRACAPYLATATLAAFYSTTANIAERTSDIICYARILRATAPADRYAIKLSGGSL